jgi:type IV secretory pathway VirB10-like protein
MTADDLAEANRRSRPSVARAGGGNMGFLAGLLGIALLGIFTFTGLSAERTSAPEATAAPPAAPAPAPQAPSVVQPLPPARLPLSQTIPAPVLVQPPVPLQGGAPASADLRQAQLALPALVVDLSKPKVGPEGAPKLAGPTGANLSPDEQFADRLAQSETRPTTAVRITNLTDVVPQGSVITGVLETAINSDLPGFVRAVVSRDVTGFDGRKVLIPTGSRLIGQYRSGLAVGQSRAFVIWTRLIRPDGVSIQLASPVTDPLGRAGLGGRVDNHFLQRFGSAILLSVINAGTAALARGSDTIVVQSAQDAQSVAGIALEKNISIPPTVNVAQGTPIRILTARDLDFSGTN